MMVDVTYCGTATFSCTHRCSHSLTLAPLPFSNIAFCSWEEESALAAGGCTEINSELSQVIDELDKAAGGNPAATALLAGGVQEE